MHGLNNWASHYITVDNDAVTYTYVQDSGDSNQEASTSIVLHLLTGQELAVKPSFTGTIDGESDHMISTFGVTLLYLD